jgi:hypothetical protein
MNPLRWDVLLVGLLLAVPVLGLGLRGDFTVQEVLSRLPWCLAAGWVVVSLIRFAGAPRTRPEHRPPAAATPEPEPAGDSEPATT